jgi:hypothetical protein
VGGGGGADTRSPGNVGRIRGGGATCGERRRARMRDLLEWRAESGWGAARGVGWLAEPENGAARTEGVGLRRSWIRASPGEGLESRIPVNDGRGAGQRSRTASARGEGSRAAVADGFGAGRGKQGSGRGRLRRGERKAGQRSRTASGDGGGDTTLAGAGLQGGNGAGGGWSGGTVRVVDLDALAPALRCSRDNIVSKDKVISHSSNSTT